METTTYKVALALLVSGKYQACADVMAAHDLDYVGTSEAVGDVDYPFWMIQSLHGHYELLGALKDMKRYYDVS